MPDRILVRGLRVFGRHGVHAAEREVGGHFVVDVAAELDLAEAGRTDRLEATLDYGPLVRDVRRIVAEESYALIEALAERIAARVLEDPRVAAATVRVTKERLPIDAEIEGVAVEIRRRR